MKLFNIFKKKKEFSLSEKDIRWNKFIFEICQKDINELNETQKNAVLCFNYDSEVNSGGHLSYFDNYPNITSKELEKALLEVSNDKITNNYKNALHSTDDYIIVDTNYYSFSPSLCDYLMEYVEDNKEEIFK